MQIGFEVYALLIIFGTVVGSFLNVVVLRHMEGSGYVKGRSHCMSCGKVLYWYELIPVLSYVLQLGKCCGCKAKLSIQYPLVELGTGILFVVVFSHLSSYLPAVVRVGAGIYPYFIPILELLLHFAIWSLFVVITVYDYYTKLIPNEFSYTLAGLAFLSMFLQQGQFATPSLWYMLAGPLLFLPFYILWKVSEGRWLGLGDGKLALGIGWFLKLPQGTTAVLFAFWIGAGVSLLIILFQKIFEKLNNNTTRKTLTLKSEIPFGPFLVLGTLLVYVFGINLYTHAFM